MEAHHLGGVDASRSTADWCFQSSLCCVFMTPALSGPKLHAGRPPHSLSTKASISFRYIKIVSLHHHVQIRLIRVHFIQPESRFACKRKRSKWLRLFSCRNTHCPRGEVDLGPEGSIWPRCNRQSGIILELIQTNSP